MANYCWNCGSPCKPEQRFCANCGTKLAAVPAEVQPVLSGQVPPATVQKKKKHTGRIVTSLILVLVMAAGAVGSFWYPGWLVKKPTGNEAGNSRKQADSPLTAEGFEAAENTVAVPETGYVQTEMGVTVDFSETLEIPDQAELTVKRQNTQADDEIGAVFTAYDVTLGNVHELGGYVEIRLPYDGSIMEKGQDPAKCIAGMYLNEETDTWESVLYEVDTENKELVIYTDHFSTYGCFEFKNEGRRMARITDIHDYLAEGETDVEKCLEALKEIVENEGKPGQACRELMLPYLQQSFQSFAELNAQTGATATYITNIATLLTSASPSLDKAIQNSELAYGLNQALGKAGLALSISTLVATYIKPDKTDQEILGMYKDAMYLLVSLSGEATLGTVASSVWVIDVAINDMGTFVYNKVKEDLTAAYRYYMTKENQWHGKPRTLKDWRRELKITAKAALLNSDDPEEAIMDEIDRYCGEFWKLSDDTLAEIYDQVGQNGRGLPDAATKQAITDEFKGELLDSLQAVFGAVQRDLEQELWVEQQKRLDKIREILNTPVSIEIKEQLEKDQKARYAGYTAVFAELNEIAVPEDWRGPLDKQGSTHTSVTYIGYLLVGQPQEVWLYAPGKKVGIDEPERKVKFALKAPKTVISIGGILPEWFNGVWCPTSPKAGEHEGAAIIELIDDHMLLYSWISSDSPENGFAIIQIYYTFEREYTYDPATETVIISDTTAYTEFWEKESHWPGYVITRTDDPTVLQKWTNDGKKDGKWYRRMPVDGNMTPRYTP